MYAHVCLPTHVHLHIRYTRPLFTPKSPQISIEIIVGTEFLFQDGPEAQSSSFSIRSCDLTEY